MRTTNKKAARTQNSEAQKDTPPPHRPKAYDEANVEAQKTIQTQPKMAHAVNEVHGREADQERRETPPAPPAQKE